METTLQAPPAEPKRRSNLLTPEQGLDVGLKDILKLLGFYGVFLQGIAILLYPKSLPEGNSMLLYPFTAILFLWAYRKYGFWPSLAQFGLTHERFRSSWKAGLLWGVGAQALSIAIGLALTEILGPWADWGKLTAEPPQYLWGWATHLISVVVFAPWVEEIIFRGIIFRTAKLKLGRTWALIITAVVFTLLHGVNPVTVGQILLVSTILTLLYERTDNLAAPVIAHGVFNLIATVVQYVHVTYH